jgi:transcriptional antiterminator RfaH
VLDSLRACEDAAGYFSVASQPRFVVGEAVRIVAGAFADAIGRFHGMTDDERVVVLLDLLGRQVKARLPLEAVTAAA